MRLCELLESILLEENTLYFVRKYKKNVAKYGNKASNVRLLKNMEKELKDKGNVTGNGLHTIRQPIRSEYKSTDLTGWKVAYVSKSDDLRIGYKKHDDGVIEVKFGKSEDIGYKH